MEVKKCSDFIVEAAKLKYKDLRWLINADGIATNIHGTIEVDKTTDKKTIIGDDGLVYYAGFNMIFELVMADGNETNDGYLKVGNVVYNGKNGIPNWKKTANGRKKVWTLEEINTNNGQPNRDDIERLTIYDQSWVNVKIDMTVSDKISRHMKIFNVGNAVRGISPTAQLKSKLTILSNPNNIEEEEFTTLLQKKIAAVLCLRYLTEIKINFDPSSAGFIFESFLAGLIGGRAINDDTEVDVVAGADNYQLKFYNMSSSYIKIIKDKTKKANFNTIIGLKERNKIHICFISKDALNKELHQITRVGLSDLLTDAGTVRTAELFKSKKIATLDLGLISPNHIGDILQQINTNIGSIWDNIGDLQENILTITTGINKEGEHNVDFDAIEHKIEGNLEGIRDTIQEITGTMRNQ